MTSIHCTDCRNFDPATPASCCSYTIQPKPHAIIISKQDEHCHNRADKHVEVKGMFGTLVTSKPRDAYFDHANWGNC